MREKIIKHKIKIIIAVIVVAILTGAYFWGGDYSKHTSDTAAVTEPPSAENDGTTLPASASNDSGKASNTEKNTTSSDNSQSDSATSDKSDTNGNITNPEHGKDQYQTDPIPTGKPDPVEPQDTVIVDTKLTCKLTVSCETILDNMDLLDEDKWELVPGDGKIFATKSVAFYEGESVYNVLMRELKKAKIPMEYDKTPIYNTAYIEGIGNIYELDVGDLSGWMYKVNGWFPNYGCSRYQLKEGDVIEYVYTCDLGKDVGGEYSGGKQYE